MIVRDLIERYSYLNQLETHVTLYLNDLDFGELIKIMTVSVEKLLSASTYTEYRIAKVQIWWFDVTEDGYNIRIVI